MIPKPMVVDFTFRPLACSTKQAPQKLIQTADVSMSHLTGWKDDMMHKRNAITNKRLERLMRRETNRKEAREKLEQEERERRRAAMESEFRKFHDIAIMETLSQIPDPMPEKSMLTKFVESITPSWMSSEKHDDAMSTATIDTEYSDDFSVRS